jgi:hypothetical protein
MPATASAIGLPFDEAIDFFKAKTRIPTTHWTDVWRTGHSHGFMVAGATTDALLSDFQDALKRALKDGTTLATFRGDFDRIVAKHGWEYNGTPGWRSRIIYETNLSTAYSAGRYAQLTEPETLAAFPYWRYQHSGSSHPRLQHLAWNGLTLRADDPFWASHYPPNGWRCGCRVVPISDGGLARMGKSGPDTAPPIQTRAWRNPKTGDVHHVPVGIDPGFDYNPGLAWQQGGKTIPVKAPDLVQTLPHGSLEPATPKRIEAFFNDPVGEIPVGRLSEQVQEALGSKSDTVMLSEDTMKKQKGERLGHAGHTDVTLEDYQALPTLISQPEAVLTKGDQRLLLLGLSDKVLALVIKTTAAADKNYLVSLHRAAPIALRRWARTQTLLLGSVERLLAMAAKKPGKE